MEHYGRYFKALRESKGLTLRDVEKITEISNAYLSQFESGKIKQPSPLTLHKLSGIYGVKYEVLMEKVGYPVPESTNKNIESKNKISYKVGDITDEEEIELINYLKFIRKRK
jgi:transcriptional regulator with XRE-family HTH domain